MIITFRSPASGDVIMFGDVAKRMLEIMGKDPAAAEGIITGEQLADTLARLKAAVEAERVRLKGLQDEDLPTSEPVQGGGSRPYVSLVQRAAPLVELLEWSLKKQKPVIWGA